MPVIKIDNRDYDVDTLSIDAKAQLQSLQFCDAELARLQAQPWFVDQIALFRLIEEGLTPAKCVYLELLLTDTTPSTTGFFRILHGSWEAEA